CGIISIISYNIISNFISSKFICVIAIGFGGVVYLTVLLLTKALKKSDVLMFPKGEKISKFLEKHNLLS
ncbi:MAG: polysaccharide biosynthesis protein, partial [Oscillospiraceae bacterium]